jgi:hypothetical protein
MKKLVLSIDLAPGVDGETVVTHLNALAVLDELQEDYHHITDWSWTYPPGDPDAADEVPPCA